MTKPDEGWTWLDTPVLVIPINGKYAKEKSKVKLKKIKIYSDEKERNKRTGTKISAWENCKID